MNSKLGKHDSIHQTTAYTSYLASRRSRRRRSTSSSHSQVIYVCSNLVQHLSNDKTLQPANTGWLTGNGRKLSNSQACCLAQLCLAAAWFLSISCGQSYVRRLYICSKESSLLEGVGGGLAITRNMVYKKHREIQYSYVSKIDLKIQ